MCKMTAVLPVPQNMSVARRFVRSVLAKRFGVNIGTTETVESFSVDTRMSAAVCLLYLDYRYELTPGTAYRNNASKRPYRIMLLKGAIVSENGQNPE